MKVTSYAGKTLPVTPGESPWFLRQNPTEEGVYKRWFPNNVGVRYCLWKDGMWRIAGLNPWSASLSTIVSRYQKFPWCGLAEKPDVQ